jgi:FHA domain-containing protein/zinc ribbon family protein
LDDSLVTGFIPGEGTFFCVGCGSQLSMRETDRLPKCPRCRGTRFRRDSIFESMQEHDGTTSEFSLSSELEPPSWLDRAREELPRPGHYLAMRDEEGSVAIFPIERGWTRIGRSIAADIRLDDPSVSRRHALIVAEPGKELRVLDDRSLNGVLVNGETVDWGPLSDGDELAIGRYSLYALRR